MIRYSELLIIVAGSLALTTHSWDFLGKCSLRAYYRSVGKMKFCFDIAKNAVLTKERLSFRIRVLHLSVPSIFSKLFSFVVGFLAYARHIVTCVKKHLLYTQVYFF